MDYNKAPSAVDLSEDSARFTVFDDLHVNTRPNCRTVGAAPYENGGNPMLAETEIGMLFGQPVLDPL